MNFLQEQLFSEDNRDVKEDILLLLEHYPSKSLDYLAERIEKLEFDPELLESALYALNESSCTYIGTILKYENHYNPIIRNAVKEILTVTLKVNLDSASNFYIYCSQCFLKSKKHLPQIASIDFT